MRSLAQYLRSLEVTQGQGYGEPFPLFPWERRFVANAFRKRGDAALSIARGNGKTTLVAGIACATIDPDGPLRTPCGETVVVASSFDQARLAFEHVLSFMETKGHDIHNRKRWRLWDTAQTARLECKITRARVRCIGSDPKRAHGLAPRLCLADEPSQWGNNAPAMRAALRTSMGKIKGSRLISLGTRPKDSQHWFAKLLDGGAAYAQVHAAKPSDPPFRRKTWVKANPSLNYLPELEAEIRQEAQNAKQDPAMFAAFAALRLNLGTSDVLENFLLEPETWENAEQQKALPAGNYVLALDLGGAAAMTGAAGYYINTGHLVALAAFPKNPSLEKRGARDGVYRDYIEMHRRRELLVIGNNTVNLPAFLKHIRREWPGKPAAIVCDRWREDLVREALETARFPPAPLILRGQGFRDGAADVRRFREAVLNGNVHPRPSFLLRSALAQARTVCDPAGNEKLSKKTQGGRRANARDDAAAAAILAVAEGTRRQSQPPRQAPRLHIVSRTA